MWIRDGAHAAGIAELRGQLAQNKSRPTEYTEGADGVEDWVIQAIIDGGLKETHRWWYTEKGRWENENETLLRNRIYHHLIAQLPKELYIQHVQGDVKAVYINIVSLGTKDSSEQVSALGDNVKKLLKAGRPMAPWLNDLYELLSQLSVLGAPYTEAQLRLLIYTNLKLDTRYDNVVRDVRRNEQWGMSKIRQKLEAEASFHNDLLANPVCEVVRTVTQVTEQGDESDQDEPVRPSRKEKNKLKAAATKKKA